MSESSRRALVLVVFFGLCLLPTVGTSYLAYVIHRPEYPGEIAQGLGEWSGLEARLDGISYPTPGTVEYQGLVFLDPEDGRPLCSLKRMRVHRSGRALQAEGMVVHGQPAKPSAEAPKRIHKPHPLVGLMQRLNPRHQGRTELTVTGFSLRSAQRQHDFAQARLRLDAAKEGAACLSGELVPPGQTAMPPIRVAWFLDQGPSLAVREFRLETGNADFPLSLVAAQGDLTSWFGSEAKLRGELRVVNTDKHGEFELRGRLTEVDLEQMVSRHLPHRLSGTSTWEVDELRWRDGQIQSMRGQVQAGPGEVGGALLLALSREAGFTLPGELPTLRPVRYQQMAFRFQLQQGTLELQGLCRGSARNTVFLADNEQPLLSTTSGSRSALRFAQALSRDPFRGPALPASYQADWLAQAFAVDPSVHEPKRTAGAAAENSQP